MFYTNTHMCSVFLIVKIFEIDIILSRKKKKSVLHNSKLYGRSENHTLKLQKRKR